MRNSDEEYEPEPEYSYDGDAGRCQGCRRIIPDEDEPYCLDCANAMAGVDTDSDYGGDYDDS